MVKLAINKHERNLRMLIHNESLIYSVEAFFPNQSYRLNTEQLDEHFTKQGLSVQGLPQDAHESNSELGYSYWFDDPKYSFNGMHPDIWISVAQAEPAESAGVYVELPDPLVRVLQVPDLDRYAYRLLKTLVTFVEEPRHYIRLAEHHSS